MKILITGANGFIGKNLAEFYKDKHELLLLYREDSIHLGTRLIEFKPDIIINCAAEIYDEFRMWYTNVNLLNIILEYCIKHPNSVIKYVAPTKDQVENFILPIIDNDILLAFGCPEELIYF